ncbi:efflux transporter outer membrane subunit [Leeia oryzae]|uniref:efflux transporter outer membrane subunit n=1 Tax=Leeia oryzae TaxID=356662 RepID=UPI00036ED081|nr:efflux transporter outer membrane subunit [Leeia oryzae]
MNRSTSLVCKLSILPLMLALAGCVAIPPQGDHLQPIDPNRVQLTSELALKQSGWPDARWWQVFGDSQLNQLVETARQGAPTLDTAKARLHAAEAAMSLTDVSRRPTLIGNASVSKELETANGMIPPPYAGHYVNQGRATLDFNYDLDWWGTQKASLQAAIGQVAAAKAEQAAAELIVTTAVTQQYYAYQSASAQLALVEQQIGKQQQLARLQQARIRQGLDTQDVIRQTDERRANLQQQAEILKTGMQLARVQLRALTGMNTLPDLQATRLPNVDSGIPASLGVDLIARRPEIDAARWRVEAGLSQEAVAKSRFYPSITLSALVGFSSIDLDKLLSSSSQIASIAPAIHLPIFDMGQLKANLASSRAQTEVAVGQYNQTVVDALKEVSETVTSLQGLSRQQQAVNAALGASQTQLNLTRARQKQQLADARQVLQGEMSVISQQAALLQLQQQRISAQINLYKALGGGYLADAHPANGDAQ